MDNRLQKGERHDQKQEGGTLEDFPGRLGSQCQPKQDLERDQSGKATGNTRNESLIHEGKEFITSKSKANAFMNRYAEISRTHPQTGKM